MIKMVHALLINMQAFATQQLSQAPVTETPALQCQLSDASEQMRILRLIPAGVRDKPASL
jgi:hypothetical protein